MQERWWTWAASSPDDRNPVVDTTGEFCAADQPTDVWFVAGTFGGAVERTCEVPAGRPIVGPVVNYVEDTQDGCTARTTGAEGEVTLDGRPQEVERLGPTRVTVRGAAGNAVTGEEGAFRAYACGLWVRIPPLAPGEHDLLIDGRSGDFHTSAHYRLLVRASND
ncbi:MAG: signal protein [Saccharothrix sp.]|nr:signal protein [Saccharothrix sp.]